ncbi:MAG: hypothetical protein WCQ21_26670 [Verrucomicrobiota bacterium]
MILPTEPYSFKLLTACFCGGADNQTAPAEMRIPSIRGQVRAWHCEISGPGTVSRIWGSTIGEAGASRVALFWEATLPPRQAQPKPCILPHKSQGPRPALAAGQSFTLTLQRLVGCSTDDWTAAQKAIKLWLLIGCLGLRANRAAGSVWPVDPVQEDRRWLPQTPAELGNTLQNLGFRWPVQLVSTPTGTKPEELRRLASDTVKGHPGLFGEIKPRIPSPTKFKVIELDGQPRLLVTAPPSVNLAAARSALAGPSKAGQFPWQPL